MKRIFLISITISFFSLSALNLQAQADAHELLDNFFIKFERNIDEAIDYLFSTNELIDKRQPGISAIKERFDMSRKLLGEYYGHELISELRAGESYRKYSFSLKYERQPLKIEIVLYKPNDSWKVQNVNFHDDLAPDFKPVTVH